MTRLLVLLTATLALTAAGCGGGDDEDKSTSVATAETVDRATVSVDAPTTPTDVSDNPAVQAAVQSCKDSIENNPQVDDSIKDDLKPICDKAASGNPDDVKEAIQEVCEKIVESSVPEGDLRDQAMETCASAQN